jgi:hypothetical protein
MNLSQVHPSNFGSVMGMRGNACHKCRALESEEQVLFEARQAGKHPIWNHGEFQMEYKPPQNVLKIGGVHVDYLLDNQNDIKAVESINDPKAFFEKLYLHFVYALAGIQPSTAALVRSSCLLFDAHSLTLRLVAFCHAPAELNCGPSHMRWADGHFLWT